MLRLTSSIVNLSQSFRFLCASEVQNPIVFTSSCIQRLKAIERSSNSTLRILVDNGGCSGFQYKFELTKKPTPGDRVIEQDGVRVIVDDVSLGLIEGSTLDYEDELIRSGFRITKNPQAEKGCSCGVSFALKMD